MVPLPYYYVFITNLPLPVFSFFCKNIFLISFLGFDERFFSLGSIFLLSEAKVDIQLRTVLDRTNQSANQCGAMASLSFKIECV